MPTTARRVTLELLTEEAYRRLQELEILNLVRLIEPERHQKSLSEKYAGQLSTEVADALLRHVEKSREEWERDI